MAKTPDQSTTNKPAPTAPFERPLVVGIETSCDDTACAVVDGAGRVLASVVSSQLAAHRPYGGVVPEIASREHLKNWPPVSAEALGRAGIELGDADAVAATRGPGLIGALLVGLSLGKGIAYGLGRPFYAVHHLEGHLYSPFLAPPPAADPTGGDRPTPPAPPEPVPERFVGLVVSGGHTTLFAVDGGAVETLGETRDDAMGEVFDKVGKRLGLPYPQGPLVDELAEAGDRAAAGGTAPAGPRLAVASCGEGSLDFSYSGLKSQTLVELERLGRRGVPTDLSRLDGDPAPPPPELLALLAAFRRAAVAQLVDRLDRLHRRRPIPLLAVSGGVAANRLLRREVAAWAADREVELRQVPLVYSGDNAAMIAYAALLRLRRGESDDPFAAEAASRIPL
jgi:N6-L-threonylcarbamoyladenine synthase